MKRNYFLMVNSFLFFIVALLAFSVSMVEYTKAIEFLSQWIVNANPKTYLTLPIYTQLTVKLRVFSCLLLLTSFIVFIWRNIFEAYLRNIKLDAAGFWLQLKVSSKVFFNKTFRLEVIFVLSITFLAFLLRYYYLFQPIRNDEAYVFEHLAKQPLLVLISTYNNVGNHIFHTLLSHVSWIFFGNSLVAVRLPVFLAGVLLVPIAYLAARKLYDKPTAMVTAALIAGSSTLIEYSVNNRGYEILTLIIACLILLSAFLLKNINRFGWVLWTIFVALGFWTLPTMFYSYGAVALWFLVSLGLDKENSNRLLILKHFIISNIFSAFLTLVLYSPVLIVFGLGHMSEMMQGAQEVPKAGMVTMLMAIKEVWLRNVPSELALWLSIFVLLGALFQKRISNQWFNIFLSSILWLMITSLFIPPYALYTGYTRLWTTHSLFFYLSIGVGFSVALKWAKHYFKDEFRSLPLIFSVLTISMLSYQEISHRYVANILQDSFHDARAVATFLKTYLNDGDCVYDVCPYGSPLKYEMALLDQPLAILKAKYSSGKELHFSRLAEPKLEKINTSAKKLIIISVPTYSGFVPSHTPFDNIVSGTNLQEWEKYGLRKIKSFPRTDLYEINLDKLKGSILLF